MNADLSKVTRKFYRDEPERLAKQAALAAESGEFYEAMKETAMDLYFKGFKFAVFDMLPRATPPAVHVGLVKCCGRKGDVPDDLRGAVAGKIASATKYKRVVWEI